MAGREAGDGLRDCGTFATILPRVEEVSSLTTLHGVGFVCAFPNTGVTDKLCVPSSGGAELEARIDDSICVIHSVGVRLGVDLLAEHPVDFIELLGAVAFERKLIDYLLIFREVPVVVVGRAHGVHALSGVAHGKLNQFVARCCVAVAGAGENEIIGCESPVACHANSCCAARQAEAEAHLFQFVAGSIARCACLSGSCEFGTV